MQSSLFIPYGKQSLGSLTAFLYQGIYTQITAGWYSDIGALIRNSYLIIIVVPPIEFIFLYMIRLILRCYDQSKCCCPTSYPDSSKKRTIQAYKNLYEGEEFDIDYMIA